MSSIGHLRRKLSAESVKLIKSKFSKICQKFKKLKAFSSSDLRLHFPYNRIPTMSFLGHLFGKFSTKFVK